jgi:hypothetical protein
LRGKEPVAVRRRGVVKYDRSGELNEGSWWRRRKIFGKNTDGGREGRGYLQCSKIFAAVLV